MLGLPSIPGGEELLYSWEVLDPIPLERHGGIAKRFLRLGISNYREAAWHIGGLFNEFDKGFPQHDVVNHISQANTLGSLQHSSSPARRGGRSRTCLIAMSLSTWYLI